MWKERRWMILTQRVVGRWKDKGGRNIEEVVRKWKGNGEKKVEEV